MTFMHILNNIILVLFISDSSLISGSTNLLKSNAKISQPSSIPITPSIITSNTSSKNNFFDISQNVCNSQSCRLPFAYCRTPTICHCTKGYANYQESRTSSQFTLPCTYVQKKQLIAFALEFFFPLGVGHFYAKRITNGVLKLFFIILTPCLLLCVNISGKNGGVGTAALSTFYSVCTFAWFITDLILFGMNNYNDGNDVPLMEW